MSQSNTDCESCGCDDQNCECKSWEVTWYEVYECKATIKAPNREEALDVAAMRTPDNVTSEYAFTIDESVDARHYISTATEV